MPAFLAVCLLALKVMNCRGDGLSGEFPGTRRMHFVAGGQQDLKRDHDFVVFDEITDEHHNLFLGHRGLGPFLLNA